MEERLEQEDWEDFGLPPADDPDWRDNEGEQEDTPTCWDEHSEAGAAYEPPLPIGDTVPSSEHLAGSQNVPIDLISPDATPKKPKPSRPTPLPMTPSRPRLPPVGLFSVTKTPSPSERKKYIKHLHDEMNRHPAIQPLNLVNIHTQARDSGALSAPHVGPMSVDAADGPEAMNEDDGNGSEQAVRHQSAPL